MLTTPTAPRYALFAEELRGRIDAGDFRPGEALPSFRQVLAERGLTQATVDQAYRLLEQDGRIERRQGRGTFVVDVTSRKQPGAISIGLRNTILVLSGAKEDADPVHRHSGWASSLSFACFDAIREQNRNLLCLDPGQLSADETQHMLASPPGGVIYPFYGHVVPVPIRGLLQTLKARGVPVVVYGDHPAMQDFDRVVSDHEQGAALLTQWLLERGCRRVVRLWDAPPDVWWLQARNRGVERVLLEAGFAPGEPLHMPAFPEPQGDPEKFRAAVRGMAGHLIETLTGPQPADALMVTSDRIVFGVAAACRLFGKTPGRDVLLAGYDNYAEDCQERLIESVGPQVTMDKRNGEAGSEMVALLLARMEGRLPPEPQRRVLAPTLVECG